MAINTHSSRWLLFALMSLAAVAGCCCQAIPLPDENCCPTDARRLYLTYGEEAVRRCPCGPDREFYGLKPTCWREWPEGWQCNGCAGMPYVDRAVCGDAICEAGANKSRRVDAAASDQIDLSNPFRSKSDAAEVPLPPMAPGFATTENSPANTTPIPAAPSQPTPTPSPALEKVPTLTAPARPPNQSTPALKMTEFENPFIKQASAETTMPATLILAPPANAPITQTAVAQTTAIEPSLNQPKPLPLIEDAKPISPKETIIRWQPPKYIPNAIAATALLTVEKPADDAPSPPAHLEKDPPMSNRVEQHLLNNLQL